MPFIIVPFTLDPDTLADEALDRLADAWDGWEGSDGDLEVIQIETLAPMASDVAEAAATVPDAIFRNYGLKLLGLPYEPGAPAVGTATFTAIDSLGHNSVTPIEFDLGGYAFTTDEPVVIAAGSSTATASFAANTIGVDANDQSGFGDPITPLAWLSSIEVTNPTEGGSEAETDEDYQDRLADRLILQTTTLVTGRDFELMALQVDGVGRAMALPNQARQVTVALTDPEGEPIPDPPASTIKDDVLQLFDDYRQVNTQYSVIDPTYTTINVTFSVAVAGDFQPDAVLVNCTAAVNQWLDPTYWGRPHSTETPASVETWVNEPVVRLSELYRVLAIPGVRYVATATLNGGTSDINLAGTAPLTRPGTVVGTAV